MRRTVLALVLVAAACSGGGDEPAPLTDPTTAPSSTSAATSTTLPTTTVAATETMTDAVGETCAALQTVVDLNALANLAVNRVFAQLADPAGADPDQLLEDLKAGFTEIDGLIEDARVAYDQAAEVAEPELASDIEALRDGTLIIWPALRDAILQAESAADIDLTEVLSEPELTAAITSAAAAVLRLDEFTVPECGFRLSN